MRLFTTVSAWSHARHRRTARRSSSLSPVCQSKTMLFAASGQTSGAPGFDGRLHVGHRGQGVVIDQHRLGGVPRRLRAGGDDEGDRVADMADNPSASTGCGGSARPLPSRFFSGTTQGRPPIPSAARSAAVYTASTPGMLSRRFGVDGGMLRRRVRAAQHDAAQCRAGRYRRCSGRGPSAGAGPRRGGRAARDRTSSWANSLPVSCGCSGFSLGRGRERPRGASSAAHSRGRTRVQTVMSQALRMPISSSRPIETARIPQAIAVRSRKAPPPPAITA